MHPKSQVPCHELDFNLGYYGHLPLKKRLIREYNQQFHTGDKSNGFFSINETRVLSASSPLNSETCSLDSGFSEAEPLDLSFNSASHPSSPKSPVSSFGKASLLCLECGKQYESNSRYRAHIRRHESKLSGRYRCNVCTKNFVQRSSLRTHERIHTGEKPYHCSQCDERFGDFSTFTKHRRTHTGEKPYPCPVCGRSFSQSGNMHRHLKVVHKPHLDLYPRWNDRDN